MPEVQLVVTGFGQFCGVADNPTEDLVKWLATLPPSSFHAGTGNCACIDTIKVSMKGVDTKLVQLRTTLDSNSSPDDIALWVHFGVASGAQEFRLEAVGYNEADFRCRDEDGEDPRHQPIDPSQPVGSELYTQLPLNALQERLSQKGHTVAVSIDPGRFVCNYVYYRSLQQLQQPAPSPTTDPSAGATPHPPHQHGHTRAQQQQEEQEEDEGQVNGDVVGETAGRQGSRRAGTSLFVHMPDFCDIGQQEQRRFALDLLLEVSLAAKEMTLASGGAGSKAQGVQLEVYH